MVGPEGERPHRLILIAVMPTQQPTRRKGQSDEGEFWEMSTMAAQRNAC